MALSHAPQPPAINQLQATHAYALVGVAQYLAVQRADLAVGSDGRTNVEAERGAVAGASAAVLTYLFPTAAQAFEDLVTAQANAGPGRPQPWFARGGEIGCEVGAGIVTRAERDGFGVAAHPDSPVRPGSGTQNAAGLR